MAQKYAFVDTEYILNRIPSYKAAQEQLDKLSEEWQAEIETMYDEIEKMYRDKKKSFRRKTKQKNCRENISVRKGVCLKKDRN